MQPRGKPPQGNTSSTKLQTETVRANRRGAPSKSLIFSRNWATAAFGAMSMSRHQHSTLIRLMFASIAVAPTRRFHFVLLLFESLPVFISGGQRRSWELSRKNGSERHSNDDRA